MKAKVCCGALIIEGDGFSIRLQLEKEDVGKLINELIEYARLLKQREKGGLVPDDVFAELACAMFLASCNVEKKDDANCGLGALVCCITGVLPECNGLETYSFNLDDIMGWERDGF